MNAKDIWENRIIPVIYRSGTHVEVRLPYREHNRNFIRSIQRRKKITYNPQYKSWNIPKTRFNELVSLLLREFGRVYVIQGYRETEICAPACWNATGHICECSCLGKNHGTRNPGGNWFVVSEALAIQDRKYLAYKLLKYCGE